jgi:hypothetical protein
MVLRRALTWWFGQLRFILILFHRRQKQRGKPCNRQPLFVSATHLLYNANGRMAMSVRSGCLHRRAETARRRAYE